MTYNIRSWAGARPEITGRHLATAAAVGPPDDAAAVARGEDLPAIDAGLEGGGLEIAGQGESASGKKGQERDGEELHFVRVFGSVIGTNDLIY